MVKATKKELVKFIEELQVFASLQTDDAWRKSDEFSKGSVYGDRRHLQSEYYHGEAMGLAYIKSKLNKWKELHS